jgi:hypothetical protein
MYNEEERTEMLRKMKKASSVFYSMATQIGCHPFIEFTGLMNEYIKICEDAHQEGIDFTQTTRHQSGENKLPMKRHHVAYLGEKLGCIYGPSIGENGKFLLESMED